MAKSPSPNEPVLAQDTDETVEIDISEADHAQLIWFCKHQGYEYDAAESLSQTFNRIRQAWEYPTITVPKVLEQSQIPMNNKPLSTGPEDRGGLPEKVTIHISHSGDGSEEEYQDVAHNGIVYRVRKGLDVEVPWFVMQILVDAKQQRYAAGRDTGIGEPRTVQAVPFTRVK